MKGKMISKNFSRNLKFKREKSRVNIVFSASNIFPITSKTLNSGWCGSLGWSATKRFAFNPQSGTNGKQPIDLSLSPLPLSNQKNISSSKDEKNLQTLFNDYLMQLQVLLKICIILHLAHCNCPDLIMPFLYLNSTACLFGLRIRSLLISQGLSITTSYLRIFTQCT